MTCGQRRQVQHSAEERTGAAAATATDDVPGDAHSLEAPAFRAVLAQHFLHAFSSWKMPGLAPEVDGTLLLKQAVPLQVEVAVVCPGPSCPEMPQGDEGEVAAPPLTRVVHQAHMLHGAQHPGHGGETRIKVEVCTAGQSAPQYRVGVGVCAALTAAGVGWMLRISQPEDENKSRVWGPH